MLNIIQLLIQTYKKQQSRWCKYFLTPIRTLIISKTRIKQSIDMCIVPCAYHQIRLDGSSIFKLNVLNGMVVDIEAGYWRRSVDLYTFFLYCIRKSFHHPGKTTLGIVSPQAHSCLLY